MKYLSIISLNLLFILVFSCKKEDIAPNPDQNEPDNIELDSGDIGILLNVRPIAKKGFFPHSAYVSFHGELAAYSSQIDIDQNTFSGYLRINRENLT